MIFYIKEGDRLPVITGTVRNANGAVQDLTNAVSTTFKMRKKGTRVLLVLAGASSIIAPNTDGRVSYAWGVGDTNSAGSYEAEFETLFSDGTNLTTPTTGFIDVIVNPDLDP